MRIKGGGLLTWMRIKGGGLSTWMWWVIVVDVVDTTNRGGILP